MTLVERAVAMLLPHCRRVLVVSRPTVPLPSLAADVVFDRPGPDTPLNGLATGLAELDAETVLVLACDLPLAAPLISRLASAPLPDPVVAADGGGRAQPLCGRYPRRPALAASTSLVDAGELRLLPLLDRLQASILVAGNDELTNVNGPEDLARVTARLPGQGRG
jgi:molybdopterin-guanine dinucleotide biosynthesis protein A